MLVDFLEVFALILGVMGARNAHSNPYCPPWYMNPEIVTGGVREPTSVSVMSHIELFCQNLLRKS